MSGESCIADAEIQALYACPSCLKCWEVMFTDALDVSLNIADFSRLWFLKWLWQFFKILWCSCLLQKSNNFVWNVCINIAGADKCGHKAHFQKATCFTICRALILSKKISPKAFAETKKKGQEAGEVGIEGLTIEVPAEASLKISAVIFSAQCEQCMYISSDMWVSEFAILMLNLNTFGVLISSVYDSKWESEFRHWNWHNDMQGTPSLRNLKIQYYELLIKYHSQHDSYLEICRCYKAIYEDEEVANDPEQWQAVLKKICWWGHICQIILTYSTQTCSRSMTSPGEGQNVYVLISCMKSRPNPLVAHPCL